MAWVSTESWGGVALVALLVACGGRAKTEINDAPTAGGGTAGDGAAGADMGVAGDSSAPEPPSSIAGRWALFSFEDPVGVQLVQTGDELTGNGCASGAPPLPREDAYCGNVHGKVVGNTASFGFDFETYSYMAETVVSKDAQRMTGRFHGTGDWLSYPTAWLRLPDDDVFLLALGTTLEPAALAGSYDLRLVEGEGGEYEAGTPYPFRYSRRMIWGALGSFWGSEASDPSQEGPIQVGPVPATSPELPISLVLERGDDGLSQVRATTASGNTYTFSATRESM